MRNAIPSIVLVEQPTKFLDEGLTDALGVVEDTTIVLDVPNCIPSLSGMDRGMEESGVGVSFFKPTDPRSLLGHSLLLEIEIRQLPPVVGLCLNQTRAKGIQSQGLLDRAQRLSATLNPVPRAPKHMLRPTLEVTPNGFQFL